MLLITMTIRVLHGIKPTDSGKCSGTSLAKRKKIVRISRLTRKKKESKVMTIRKYKVNKFDN